MPVIAMQVVEKNAHEKTDKLFIYTFESPELGERTIVANLTNVYEVGDVAIVEGALYEALQASTDVYPPDDATTWSPLPTPVDDVRVERGSDYEGIGLLDTKP